MRFQKYLKLFLIGILVCCFLAACKEVEQREPSTIVVSEPVSFQLELQEATPTGIKVEVENFSEEDLHWGSWTLEEKVDGIWYNIEFVPPEGTVLMQTLSLPLLPQGETREIVYKWDAFVGELKPGYYRVIREFFYEERKRKDKIYVACEFEIE